MIAKSLQTGLRNGLIFGIIILFLVLIGFDITGSSLIGKVIGNSPPASSTKQLPYASNLVILISLLGIWNGAMAAKRIKGKSPSQSIAAGFFAGIFTGLITAVFALWIGTALKPGVDLRVYLIALSSDAIKFFLFQQSPSQAALIHLGLLAAGGLLGGLIIWLNRLRKSSVAFTRVNESFSNTATRWNLNVGILRNRYIRYTLYLLGFVVLIILPRIWGSYWNFVVGTVGIYIVLGLGLNIIVGYAGQLVLGYVAFFAVGAYSVALLNSTKPLNLHWGFWIALLIGIALAILAGFLVGLPTLRLRGDYLAIVTLGFGEIIRILLKSDLMTDITGGPRGVQDIAGPTIFGYKFSSDIDFFYLILGAVILAIFIASRLQNSRVGRTWLAIREDETVAKATGVNAFSSKLLALAIGAALAGLAGVIFAARNQYTGPDDHDLMVSVNVLCLVIVGGMGSIPGVILGAFVLKGLPEVLRDLENYRLLFFGMLLIIMMIIRPEGLWPATRQRLELRGGRQEPQDVLPEKLEEKGLEA